MTIDTKACSFCGTEAESNTRLTPNPTVEYLDGPPKATVSEVVLCRQCAAEVDLYFGARQRETTTTTPENPFTRTDAKQILDHVSRNPEVLLTAPTLGYGVRYIDEEWKHAYWPTPGEPTVETLSRKEVLDKVQDTGSVTIRRLDPPGWNWWALDGNLFMDS